MSISLSDHESGARYDGDASDALEALQERLERVQAAHITHGQRSIIMFDSSWMPRLMPLTAEMR